MTGAENVKEEALFIPSHNTRTKGHPMKPTGGRFKTNQRTDFFPQGAVELGNSSPLDVVKAETVTGVNKEPD